MTSHLGRIYWLLCLLGAFGLSVSGELEALSLSLHSLADDLTRLPCQFRDQQEQVVQVSWTRERPDGSKDQVITAHRTEGHTEFGRYSGRVHFESSDPMADAALIIRNTEVSDEGNYTCHISTFPSGNFERQLSLTVWTTPISSLEPVEMVEGQSFHVAATCRSVARPPPRLTWDTDLAGQSQNRSSEGGTVSTHFSLHPLRSMNGKALDCLVWHPSKDKPHRISNQLVVHFPPESTVSGYDGNWFVGLLGASLRCESGGNPKPQSFTWSRRGRAMPKGVSMKNNMLVFDRPLALSDDGTYECVAKNSVGTSKADIDITIAGLSVSGELEDPSLSLSLRSLAEGLTRLPCQFRVPQEQVVQVSWTRERPDGSKDQVITAHRTEGHTEFGRYSGRVHFESSDPMADAALIIRSTEVSDEGTYTCHISTFPSGNFERQLLLTVWTTPISSLEPVEMVEGQSFHVAATCRSVARPPPRLTWDTDLAGQSQNRSSEGGTVSTHFSLHPLRSMNGKALDCLVWHPSKDKPHRISNRLVVHFPPDSTISGYDGNWFVGLLGASLRCESGGNPKPQSFTWSRRGGAMPKGVSMKNNTLVFDRPLALSDDGTYECVAKNSVGTSKADIDITIAETARQETPFSSLLIIILGVVAGVLVVAMVISVIMMNRYHKSRNRKLEMELSEKKEEISTLSRQASFRRINSVSTDNRMQMDESAPLRVEATLRTSLSSLGEQARCRDSRSTLSGGRDGGGGGAVDFLGRPALYNTSRRGERVRERDMEREGEKAESRQRVESFVMNSSLSLDHPLHAPLHPTLPMGGRNHISSYAHPALTVEDEEEEDEREGEQQIEREERVEGDQYNENSSLVLERLSSPFPQVNGTLYPKQHHELLLHHKGQIV